MSNKSVLKYGLAGAAVLGFAGLVGYGANAANPGNPADLATTADVTIVSTITVTQDRQLRFGQVVKPPTANTATFTVAPGGGMTVGGTGGISNGGQTSGEFSMTGEVGASYTFSTGSIVACTTGGGGTVAPVLSALTDDGQAATLNDTVQVGATLTVTNLTDDGTWDCGFTVSAVYS